jgi:hypothetical protein
MLVNQQTYQHNNAWDFMGLLCKCTIFAQGSLLRRAYDGST